MAYEIVKLRRMIAEPTEDTYSDEDLISYIEKYPLPDDLGLTILDDGWEEDYDYCAVAAEIWAEKAAALAEVMDFNADGGSYSASQKYKHALNMSSFYKSRSHTHISTNRPKIDDDVVIN